MGIGTIKYSNNLFTYILPEIFSFLAKIPLITFTSVLKVILWALAILMTFIFTLAVLSSLHVRKARVVITIFVYSTIFSIGSLLISAISIYSFGIGFDMVNGGDVFTAQLGFLYPVIGILLPFKETTILQYFSNRNDWLYCWFIFHYKIFIKEKIRIRLIKNHH